MNETLAELILFLKEASPLVWSTLIKQVYIEATSQIIWGVILLVACVILLKFTKNQKAQYDKDYGDGKFVTDDVWALWSCLGIFITGGFSLYNFVSAAMWICNPEFYAIRFLLDKLGG